MVAMVMDESHVYVTFAHLPNFANIVVVLCYNVNVCVCEFFFLNLNA
jgi:hypothetical protein